MAEWLLSGHNTQETTGIALPVTLTMTEPGLDDQISWSVSQFTDDPSILDPTLKPTVAIQGHLYLNITYFVQNAGRVLPFDPESLGAPKGLVPEPLKAPLAHQLRLPFRFLKLYRWASRFYRYELPVVDRQLREIYWKLQEEADFLPWVDALFEPGFYARSRVVDRAHVFISLIVTALDSMIRQQVPQLLNLSGPACCGGDGNSSPGGRTPRAIWPCGRPPTAGRPGAWPATSTPTSRMTL